MIDVPGHEGRYQTDRERGSKTQGRNTFLTEISCGVFTRSRSFANEEVQNDKYFLNELC